MAENTVVKDQLTNAMVEAGAELTKKLDEMGVATTAALWLFEPEVNEWRLVFASPEVTTRGRARSTRRFVRPSISSRKKRRPHRCRQLP